MPILAGTFQLPCGGVSVAMERTNGVLDPTFETSSTSNCVRFEHMRYNSAECPQRTRLDARVRHSSFHYMEKNIKKVNSIQADVFFNTSLHDVSRNASVQCDYHGKVSRIGEADHPGPSVTISSFNPTQLLGHEDEICAWSNGVWLGCETSHTEHAMRLSIARFKKQQVNSIFSRAVARHASNAGLFRGRASGTVILSRYPIRPFPVAVVESVAATSRFVDAIIQLGNRCSAYMCAIYGPPQNDSFADSDRLFFDVATPGIQRALSFKGPAVITGDFNRNLEQCPFWATLQQQGWKDAAQLAYDMFGVLPQPTCRNASRKTFILVNPEMVQFFQGCQINEEFQFDSHPILEATFHIGDQIPQRMVWKIPSSFDDMIVDDVLFSQHAQLRCEQRSVTFEDAYQRGDVEQVLRQFALAFEESIQKAVVDVTGQNVDTPRGCFQRCDGKNVRVMAISAPVIRKARHSELNVEMVQPTICMRWHIKQGRRLQSLLRQVRAMKKSYDDHKWGRCNELWHVILKAQGFRHGFARWILEKFAVFVPLQLPDEGYLQALVDEYIQYQQTVIQQQIQLQRKMHREHVLNDVAGGGTKAFRCVKDPLPPPLAHLGMPIKQEIKPVRIRKEGHNWFEIKGPNHLIAGHKVVFHNQEALIESVQGGIIRLDRKVKIKNVTDWTILQTIVTAHPLEMQKIVADTWSKYWGKRCDDIPCQAWDEANNLITSLHDCPSCPFKELDVETWKQSMQHLNFKSARGSCGFSYRDLSRLPLVLLDWLFKLYHLAEQGFGWPRQLALARVTMLAKPDSPLDNPNSVRPITIMSILYRQWSRIRSKQMLDS